MEPSTPPDRLRPALLFRWGALFSLGAATTVIGLYALYTVRAILVRILIALSSPSASTRRCACWPGGACAAGSRSP
jgi:hypothetical protein